MKTKIINYNAWKESFEKSFSVLKKLWWRIGLINILTIAVMGIFTFLTILLLVVFQGSQIQIFIQKMELGMTPNLLPIGVLIALSVWILGIIVFASLGKISNWLLVSKIEKKKKAENPFRAYFRDSWKYLFRYIGTICWVYWPFLLLLAFWIAYIGILSFMVGNDKQELYMYTGAVVMAGTIVFCIYRIFKYFFAVPALIFEGKDVKKTLSTAEKITKGNWWGVAISMMGGFLLLGGLNTIFSLPEYLIRAGFLERDDFATILQYISEFIGTLLGIFIFSPIIVGFVYFFMLRLIKEKKI